MARRLCTDGQQEFAGRIVGFLYTMNCSELVFLIIQTPKKADSFMNFLFQSKCQLWINVVMSTTYLNIPTYV